MLQLARLAEKGKAQLNRTLPEEKGEESQDTVRSRRKLATEHREKSTHGELQE